VAFLRSLRKTLAPTQGPYIPVEVKAHTNRYFEDLRRSLSAQTGREWTVERAISEGYERLVWVFKPVNVISENQRARKFVVRQGSSIVEDHPLSRLLNIRANPWETGPILRKRLSSQILLSPVGAFAEVKETNGGDPYRIDLLPPHRMKIVRGSGRDDAGRPVDPRDVRSLVDHYELLDGSGRVERGIDVEDIRWFRDPHPLDPFRGITPLEAAGLSVELDHFARLYNVQFMKNDGRPGGIVAVKGDFDDDEQAAVERKFDKGPVAAGKLTVISADGLAYVDPGGKPRDMSYVQLARNAKIELLSSFGVSETMMGYAGDKTFANAEQERLGFWQDTMPPHLAIITDGFNEDTDDDLEPGFDLSDVEVLAKLNDARLARYREEVAAGLRSPYSYAQKAGDLDEIEDTIHTRSLYIASGKQPLPINAADAEEMGLGPTKDDAQTGGAPGGAITPGEEQPALEAGGDAATGGGSPEGAVPAGPGAAQAALAAAGTANPASPVPTGGVVGAAGGGAAAAALAAASRPQAKGLMLRVVGGKADDAWMTDDVDEAARDQLEAAIASVLTELGANWCERAAARVASTKSRKNTRHWAPEGDRPVDTRLATKAIDPTYAVDEQAWAEEAEAETSPLLIAAALAAAYVTWQNLGGIGTLPAELSRRATTGAREVAGWIGERAARAAQRLTQAINEADQSGVPMDRIVEGVLSFRDTLAGWATAMGVQSATSTTEGARAAAAAQVVTSGVEVVASTDDDPTARPAPASTRPDQPQAVHTDVVQRWRTRRDDRVRETHRRADGQQQPAGMPFEVGGFLLRWPGDHLAPPSETRNCRCAVSYRSRRTGRFVSRPTAVPMEAAR